jgi:hypothetical protein
MGLENPHEPPSVGSLPLKHQASSIRLAVFTNHDNLKVLADLIVEVCLLRSFAVFPKGCTHLWYKVNFELIDISRQPSKSEAALILYNIKPVILK